MNAPRIQVTRTNPRQLRGPGGAPGMGAMMARVLEGPMASWALAAWAGDLRRRCGPWYALMSEHLVPSPWHEPGTGWPCVLVPVRISDDVVAVVALRVLDAMDADEGEG